MQHLLHNSFPIHAVWTAKRKSLTIPGDDQLTTFSTDAVIHVLLVAFSFLVLSISILAYIERRSTRYLFLTLAFTFLTLSQFVELVETLFLSSQLILIPSTGIHLSHFFDFLMLSSFSFALLTRPGENLASG